jgi:hypothetical protein
MIDHTAGESPPILRICFNEADGVGHESYDVYYEGRWFSGATTFRIQTRALDEFVGKVEALDRTLQGEAELRAGWGENDDFRLTIRALGSTGHLLAEVEIAAEGADALRHQLFTHLLLPEPKALTRFWRVLSRRDRTRAGVPAILTAAAELPD